MGACASTAAVEEPNRPHKPIPTINTKLAHQRQTTNTIATTPVHAAANQTTVEKDSDPHSETDTNNGRHGTDADLHSVVPILSPPVNLLLANERQQSAPNPPFSPSVTGGSLSSSTTLTHANSSSAMMTNAPMVGTPTRRPVSSPPVTYVEVKANMEHSICLHGGSISDLALTDVPGEVLMASDDKSLSLYNFKSRAVEKWSHHSKGVTRVAWSPHDGSIFSGSRDSTIRQWKRGTFKEVQTYRGHTLAISALALASSSTRGSSPLLISGARDYSLRTWSIETGQQISMHTIAKNIVTSIKWISPNDRGNSAFNGKIVDPIDSACLNSYSLSSPPPSSLVDSGTDPYCFLQTSEDPYAGVRIWDVRMMLPVQTFASDGGKIIRAVQSDPHDSMKFIAATESNDSGSEIRLWDRRMCINSEPSLTSSSSDPLLTLSAHADSINSIVYLPTGSNGSSTYVATASSDKSLKIWDLSSATSDSSRCTQVLTYRTGRTAISQLRSQPVEFTSIVVSDQPIMNPSQLFSSSGSARSDSSNSSQPVYLLYSSTSSGIVSSWCWNPKAHQLELIAQTNPTSNNTNNINATR